MRDFFLPMDSSNSTLKSGHWYRIDNDIALWDAEKAHKNKTITRRQAKAEKDFLISVDSIYPKFRNNWKSENLNLPDGTPFRGTWQKRWGEINSILSNPENIKRWQIEEPRIAAEEVIFKKELEEKTRLENSRLADIESVRLQEIQNQEITFNEQQNSGDFNETPITEINFDNSCSECTGTIKSTDPIEEKQLTENYLKIGGIAAVGIGILLLYTRRNKK
jgi:hypothetical protein